MCIRDRCNRVAVIDHHRRGTSYIEKMALNYHEPYASSTCELVTELLQYLVEPSDILRCEAEALLAGIVLDTKNFTNLTGGRTCLLYTSIKVNRVELKNILPPREIQNAMEKQMKAERERRESILQAEGEKASKILVAEGEKQSTILRADAAKQAKIMAAEAEAQMCIRDRSRPSA